MATAYAKTLRQQRAEVAEEPLCPGGSVPGHLESTMPSCVSLGEYRDVQGRLHFGKLG